MATRNQKSFAARFFIVDDVEILAAAFSLWRTNISLGHAKLGAFLPAELHPEAFGLGVVRIEKDIASGDARFFQFREATENQFCSQSVPAVRWRDREMIQTRPPAIVAAEDGADEVFSLARDEAEAAVSFQKFTDLRLRVGFTQADALGVLP